MTSVVVDLGCLDREGASSLKTLAKTYKPDRIYGFDPSPLLKEREGTVAGVPVTLRRSAAWTHDGTIFFSETGADSRVGSESWVGPRSTAVDCFDFSSWLRDLRQTADVIVLKMDVEFAEFPLLERMLQDGTDEMVDELLVEWHGENYEQQEKLEGWLHCPVRRWWM